MRKRSQTLQAMGTIVWHRRDDCPHCRKFRPVWTEITADIRAKDFAWVVRTIPVGQPLPPGVDTVPKLEFKFPNCESVFWGDSSTSETAFWVKLRAVQQRACRPVTVATRSGSACACRCTIL